MRELLTAHSPAICISQEGHAPVMWPLNSVTANEATVTRGKASFQLPLPLVRELQFAAGIFASIWETAEPKVTFVQPSSSIVAFPTKAQDPRAFKPDYSYQTKEGEIPMTITVTQLQVKSSPK